jgi:hypothetical protein
MDDAHKAIDTMRQIHTGVEKSRGASIPDWAYRDVLFMLIHYSIASYELLESKLTPQEKEEVYNVFYRVGTRMRLNELPLTYTDWLPVREAHLKEDLQRSEFTDDLFSQYKKHLGPIRFKILLEGQKLVVPARVKAMLHFSDFSLLTVAVPLYKLSRKLKMDRMLKNILLPAAYKDQINEIDVPIN